MAKKFGGKIQAGSSNTTAKKLKKDICFTLMPFGGWFDSYYEEIYKPAIIKAGLEPLKADDLYRPSAIIHDIWECIQKSKVVVADLTGKNPNVFYEMGLAHARILPVILIAETLEDVPFDLRGLRVIIYDKNDPNWATDLKQNLVEYLKVVIKSPKESIPPVFSNMKTRKISQKSPGSKLQNLQDEINLLRKEMRYRISDLAHISTAAISPSRSLYRRPNISISEARRLIENYIRHGMPLEEIVEILLRRGVPRRLAEDLIISVENDLHNSGK